MFISFSAFSQEIKQGLYRFNGGLNNKSTNTKKYVYGPGLTYRYSKDLDIVNVGLRHHFNLLNKRVALSYGLESDETAKQGIKYPLHIRGEHKISYKNSSIDLFFSNRYYPEFYSQDTLHFFSIGGQYKESFIDQTYHFAIGSELSRLYNRDGRIFANLFYSVQKSYKNMLFKIEYIDLINNKSIPHLKDWLLLGTFGIIF